KRKMIYGCQYQKRKGLLEKTGNYELTDIKDFLKSVKTKSIFIGDGANLYSADIRSSSKCSSIYQDRVGFPQVKYVFPLVYEKFQRKAYEDPAALIPIYLYPEDCQVKKKAV
ncbi:MAG: hypothetical protein KC618_09055, partial [Candidatus Omnitrophica bacterium]|nr:hypothetical protein [Candidatus Omnitrophota bacterium]